MPEIEYRKNITSFAMFAGTVPEWMTTITGMPDFSPDEVIVRQITFSCTPDLNNKPTYMLWSSMNNDFIGSMCDASVFTISPNFTHRFNNPVSNVLQFRLYTPGFNQPLPVESIIADIIIHLEFVKYKHSHRLV